MYRARPGHGKGADGTRGEPSNVSVSSFSASSFYAGSRCRPPGKRPGQIESDGEDNGHKKRSRAGKSTASNGQKKVVHCLFKIRHPEDPKFISCPAFEDWGRLREHLLDRRHKPPRARRFRQDNLRGPSVLRETRSRSSGDLRGKVAKPGPLKTCGARRGPSFLKTTTFRTVPPG